MNLRKSGIVLNDRDPTVTREDGTLDLTCMDWRVGDNSVTASLPGYQEWTEVIELFGDEVRVELGIKIQR